tara:strand:- start:947 stop:1240 length:294 start_codon:yes stop_codon:yes gene_type:complete
MKVKENFNIDLCEEVLQKHFTDCSVEKKSGIMGEYIDLKKSYTVGSRIIYRKKNEKLNIGSRPNMLNGLFGMLGSLPSMSIVSEVKKILESEFGLED